MENKLPLDSITTDQWEKAIENIEADDTVGILHAEVTGDASYRVHVASIPEKVSCHVHSEGDEEYKVVKGSGTLYWGKFVDENNIEWEQPKNVTKGDSFVIPEGYAHQLKKEGSENLVILFGCPDAHLDNDRIMLPDSPEIQQCLDNTEPFSSHNLDDDNFER